MGFRWSGQFQRNWERSGLALDSVANSITPGVIGLTLAGGLNVDSVGIMAPALPSHNDNDPTRGQL